MEIKTVNDKKTKNRLLFEAKFKSVLNQCCLTFLGKYTGSDLVSKILFKAPIQC